jgi:hypothetical protein
MTNSKATIFFRVFISISFVFLLVLYHTKRAKSIPFLKKFLVYIRPPGHFTAVKYYCGKGVK